MIVKLQLQINIQTNFQVDHTLSFSLFDLFFSTLHSGLSISLLVHTVSICNNLQKIKNLTHKYTPRRWMKTGSRLEVDLQQIGSRLEQTGSRLEVNWKQTGSKLEETGRRLVQKWFNQILRQFTLFVSICQIIFFCFFNSVYFICFFYSVQWIINDIYFSDSKVLDISTKIEYIAQNHNSQKEKN